jgi:hypothetical protein
MGFGTGSSTLATDLGSAIETVATALATLLGSGALTL